MSLGSSDIQARHLHDLRNKPIDGAVLKELVQAGLTWLRTNQQTVNALNVFPVPDGDTGTNMTLTMQSAWNEIAELGTRHVGEMAAAVAECTPDLTESITGVPAADIETAARIYAEAERAGIYYTMGITQHTSGTNNVLALANLALLTGNMGKPGAGLNPLRGQNNVQGASDMGANPLNMPGYQRVDNEEARARIGEIWGHLPKTEPGLTATAERLCLPAAVGLAPTEAAPDRHR